MRTQMVKAIIDELKEMPRYWTGEEGKASKYISISEVCVDEIITVLDELQDRIKELEANIIEADAQYNVDKKPGDIYSAELALVRMAAMGAEALYNQKETE